MPTKGWAWILRNRTQVRTRTELGGAFDGTYTAACPVCGHDTTWNAFTIEPACPCPCGGGKS